MNESLRRALMSAGLNEEDVAARLGVDPKTARRWLEGRLPLRRHRWELVTLLGLEEGDLWPELRRLRRQPDEVVALYPRCADMPAGIWVDLLACATTQVAVLADSSKFLDLQFEVRGVLLRRAEVGAEVRLCLAGGGDGPISERNGSLNGRYRHVSASLAPLVNRQIQVRVHVGESYERMVLADDELLLIQRVWGVPAGLSPVLRLQRRGDSGLFDQYSQSFERVWAAAWPL